MASSGKKGKKIKGITLALNDFLQETPGAPASVPIRKSNITWADEVEDNYDQYESSRPKANVVLPTAPKSARGFDEFNERIPQHPPYNAYITNLPYDVQEEEIAEFFGDLKISNMRIPKDERPGETPRLKGFGYIEFEDRESLIGALSITDCTLKNRRIRIEIADNSDNDRKRGGRMDNNRDRQDRSDVTSGDWRSRPRTEPPEPERNRGGFNRDRDRDSNAGERGGSWRDSTDRPNLRDSDRVRDGYGDRSRFNDGEKRGFGPRRDRDEKEGFTRGGNRDDADKFEPKTRPKLVLARRTIPLASGEQPQQETVANPVPASNQSSIFGRAKPVDTSIRERQIEDMLAKQSEKSAAERDSKRDGDRRDRGRRDDDSRWGKDRRKDSPIRRTSPEYRNNSPPRNRDYNRRSDSPDRRYSPDRRRRSPEYRRNSRDRRRSPDGSPIRRRSPEYRKGSPPRRRDSPDRRRRSPDYARNSRDRRRSPDTSPRRNSSDYRRISPDARGEDGPEPIQRRSPDRRRSPEYKKSPDRRRDSPELKKRSPDRSQTVRSNQRKNDDRDKKGPSKLERPPRTEKDKVKKEEKSHRENHDREMPKLKEPETPNFAACNKYAFLDAAEDLE
ncbi:hypothetical protein RN001_006185 [Aquatica leii]|uniref:RRM domain-containing protein n=1 Tax=Aquatica leii TaxID=1421715 RepID=A0AAN7PI67_9COLE|nr:hypothetical protein RN001_006185 [Aquatica leii]